MASTMTALSASSTSVASSSTSMTSSHPWRHVSEECGVFTDILLDISSGVLHLLVDHREDGSWYLAWVLDLQESMLVTFSLLTCSTEVEVLANTALVSHT